MSQPLVSIDLKRGIFRRYVGYSRYTGKPLMTHRREIIAEDWQKVLDHEWVLSEGTVERYRTDPLEADRVGWQGPSFTPRGDNAA